MTEIISIKSFLGKYYPELLYSAAQDKYKDTGLDSFFEQRFHIQNNKVRMIIDPTITGLIIFVAGNEIHISQELYDHPSVVINNSLSGKLNANPKNLYNPEIFSTVAYLVCQNHTTFQIIEGVDEPIYVRYRAEYETFYNSVLIFDIANGIDVEIVEEIESFSALNIVTNYILSPSSRVNLSTFYLNHLSAVSFCYRNVISQADSSFNHTLFGRGSANIIDENRIQVTTGSQSELLGLVNSNSKDFHSILYVEPGAPDYAVDVNYKDILYGKHNVTFYPVVSGKSPISETATIEVSNITLEEIPTDIVDTEIEHFVSDIAGRAILERIIGVERFYENKSKFLDFL
jgi:hypothetical protein